MRRHEISHLVCELQGLDRGLPVRSYLPDEQGMVDEPRDLPGHPREISASAHEERQGIKSRQDFPRQHREDQSLDELCPMKAASEITIQQRRRASRGEQMGHKSVTRVGAVCLMHFNRPRARRIQHAECCMYWGELRVKMQRVEDVRRVGGNHEHVRKDCAELHDLIALLAPPPDDQFNSHDHDLPHRSLRHAWQRQRQLFSRFIVSYPSHREQRGSRSCRLCELSQS
mmetsp:Transcript_72291/g.186445  ORF Transcript_72291/g.186445 Transcript_72291/m.186445 type:complete len:228 (+) Transcript_72291:649-1332(+)